ncbi:MAG: hypothetical protein ACI9XC_001019 [Gammaproteobacteria bacterium]|jgi:hypothetical protein
MIAGLPIEAWLLLAFSIGVPLAIEFKFFLTHRNKKQKSNEGFKS